MSKKKGKAAQAAEDSSWDEGLINEKVCDELWSPFVVFLVPTTAEADTQIKALDGVINDGNRKKFVFIDKENLMQTAQEDSKTARLSSGGGGKKSKQSSAPSVAKPLHIQVCDHVVNAASSGEPLSPSLCARMIKYMILKKRLKDLVEKKVLAEVSDPDIKKGNGDGKKKSASSGRTSKTGKKGKETPLSSDNTPTIAMPSKPLTQMKKRGEEDLDSKYLNDEPDPGPSCYFVLTGFNQPELFKQLSMVQLKVNALIKISQSKELLQDCARGSRVRVSVVENTGKDEINQSLTKFWKKIYKVIQASPNQSMLRDMAILDITLKAEIPKDDSNKKKHCQDIFDEVAYSSYHLLEQFTQYQYYLEYLDLLNLPCNIQEQPAQSLCGSEVPIIQTEEPDPNMNCYNNFLKDIPEENITVSLVVHAIVEQVSAAISEASCCQDLQKCTPSNPVTVELTKMFDFLSLSAEDKQLLGVKKEPEVNEYMPQQVVLPHGDEISRRNIGRKKSSIAVEESTSKLVSFNSFFNVPLSNSPDLQAQVHALNHLLPHENWTVRKFSHALILMSLEKVLFQNASTSPKSSLVSPLPSSLVLDHPFNLEVLSNETSIVPLSETDKLVSHSPASYSLQLDDSVRSLKDYSVLEVFEASSLLQELISLQFTHPYIEFFKHQHSEKLIMIFHTGFDGSAHHTYTLSSHTHTKIGFQSFLQHVSDRYSYIIEEAVKEDEKNKKKFDEERKELAALRLKEAEERQDEVLSPVEEEQGADNTKGKKKSEPSSQRQSHGKAAKKNMDTAISSHHDLHRCEALSPEYEKEKRFTGYDMDGTVLLKESTHVTLFTADGIQVQCKKSKVLDDLPTSTEISLLHNGHRLVCCQVLTHDSTAGESNSELSGFNTESQSHTPQQEDTKVPQPPSGLKSAYFHAHFNDSLQISCSQYGPKANGKLPYLPYRPKVLDHSPQPDLLQALHPGAQQGVSPKLTKKQQEHQQQLLEQQRAMEAQIEKEKKMAQAKYKREYDTLVSNNQYQQLHICTEFGLEVKCQVYVEQTDTSAPSLEAAFVVVKQKYPFPSSVAYLNEHLSKEKSRFYHPRGYVIKFLDDESIVILCADGTQYRSASSSEVELFNNKKKAIEEECLTPRPKDGDADGEKTLQRVVSTAKSIVLEEATESPVISNNKIWIVTTSAGRRFMFEQEDQKELGLDEVSVDPASEQTSPSPISNEVKKNPVFIPLSPVYLLKATDPVSKAVYITREDKIVLIQKPDNSFVTEFQDGTRFTVSGSQHESETSLLPNDMIIECSGFACVSFKATAECNIHFPDDSLVTCSASGAYLIKKEKDYELSIDANGKAFYRIPNATYVLNHTSVNHVFSGVDSSGNTFSLHASEEAASVKAPNPIKSDAFKPRYFMLDGNDSYYELHDLNTFNRFISEAESDSQLAVVRDPVPGEPDMASTTVIEPIWSSKSSPLTVPYKDSSIVPYNLRTTDPLPPSKKETKKKPKFGALVGKGLEIGNYKKSSQAFQKATPLGFKYRQFLSMQTLTEEEREQIKGILTTFIIESRERVKQSESMQPIEMRTSSELEAAKVVNQKVAILSVNDISDRYDAAISGKKKSKSVHVVPASMSQEGLDFIKQSKAEVQAAENMKIALREKIIPPYFQSKYVEKFLPLQSPDMPLLTSKLAHSKADNEPAVKSQSTLQSSSLTLTLEESDSVFHEGHRKTSSPIKIRPSHPTPNHAQGQGSPTELRPTNPTPFKAVADDATLTSYFALPPMDPAIAQRDLSVPKLDSIQLDVTGQPRETIIPKPTSLLGSRPGEKLNLQFSAVEEPVRRKVFTSSSIPASSKLRGFEVIPEEIDFGVLKEGLTYSFKFILKNTGIEPSHFKIKQPPPSTGIKTIYSPGTVAAGLSRSVTVEMFAMAVGAIGEQGTGSVKHDLQIVTEHAILHMPIRATVLTSSLYNAQMQFPYKQAPGVELVTTNVRQGVARPHR